MPKVAVFSPNEALSTRVTSCTVTTGGVTLYWLDFSFSSGSPTTVTFTSSIRYLPAKASVAALVSLRLRVKATSVLGVPTRVNTGLLRGLPATWDTEVALAPPVTEPATYSIPVGKVTVTSAVFLAGGNFILIVRVPISKLVLLAKCTSLWATTLLTAS